MAGDRRSPELPDLGAPLIGDGVAAADLGWTAPLLATGSNDMSLVSEAGGRDQAQSQVWDHPK